jgi:hypothetical protein
MTVRVILMALSAFLAANGAFMLAAPMTWYYRIDSVPLSGPLNEHFVRDIGCGFLAAAAGVLLAALRRDWFVPGMLTALVFVGGHALLHVVEALAGAGGGLSLSEQVGIYGPALLLLLLLGIHLGRGARQGG